MRMEELKGFGKKYSLTLLSPANNYFIGSRDENDESIYTYNGEFMRDFVRRSIKRIRSSVLNEYYKYTISNEVFKIISQEKNVQDNICEIIEKNFEFSNKQRKIKGKEYDSQVKVYRDINQDEKEKHINDNLTKLPIGEKFQKLKLKNVMMDFDATSLYPSAMWVEKSVYPKIEILIAMNVI